jgi:hypothetical protein
MSSNGYEVAYEAIANMTNADTAMQISDAEMTQTFTTLLEDNYVYWYGTSGVITQLLQEIIDKKGNTADEQLELQTDSTEASTQQTDIQGQQSSFETMASQDATNESAYVGLLNPLNNLLYYLANLLKPL